MNLDQHIEKLIDLALKEDIGTGDITSHVLIPSHVQTSGEIVLKQGAVPAGLKFLEQLYQKIDPDIKVQLLVKEGSYQKAGTLLAKVTGPARGILSGERVALNLLQHASAVATATYEFVRKLKGLKCDILDTRKTLPGIRALEKYAVQVGGGKNHRFGLYDGYIIKRNHLSFFSSTSENPFKDAVKLVQQSHPNIPVEVEVHNPSDLDKALASDAVAIMLCKMAPQEILLCVKKIRKTNKKVYVESLGTITVDTVRSYGETGVDGIAIGSITHSAHATDIVMRLK
jgi:nicotinate-nucleotide pyrophosphorylase (carboxylating)